MQYTGKLQKQRTGFQSFTKTQNQFSVFSLLQKHRTGFQSFYTENRTGFQFSVFYKNTGLVFGLFKQNNYDCKEQREVTPGYSTLPHCFPLSWSQDSVFTMITVQQVCILALKLLCGRSQLNLLNFSQHAHEDP